jgi:hypothetical protein
MQEAVFVLVEGACLSPDMVVFLDGANDSAKAYQKLPAGYPILFDYLVEEAAGDQFTTAEWLAAPARRSSGDSGVAAGR